MKRLFLLALALVLLACLSACGDFVSILPGTEAESAAAPAQANTDEGDEASFAERPLLSFVGWEAFGDSYYTDTPLALSYQPETEDGEQGCRSYIFDRAGIIAGCDAIRGITVTGRAEGEPVSSAEYVLTRSTGPEYRLTFGSLADGTRVLCTYTGNYTVTGGDALWALHFPAYGSDYDVFDLYFSDDVRAFADNFYTDMPVSVGHRMTSGATITSTDPQAVTAAFQALADASVIVVENNPDQNVDLNQIRDYIFTMEDGTAYTFRFAQRCLAVTANSAFGPVYYWISGVDTLWNVQIVPESGDTEFRGGYVWELREDTRRTFEAVDGLLEDVSVAGVYVDYTINGEKAYLTLSGDVADSFLRQLSTIRVTGETVEYPEGDTFTVSVTLTGDTGPFLSFTGNAIQQMVGINYLCDSGDMDAMRGEILRLAAEGYNKATVTSGNTE